uniref:small ribosomal subunit protein mS26 n=1 Tax=Myxine glutinosa TaxID=7769 RepID=UPI00358EADD3
MAALLAIVRRLSPTLLHQEPTLVQAVRGRKRRTDPKAKSKIDLIRDPILIDPVETLVLNERYRQYKVIVEALRKEFRAERVEQYRQHLLSLQDSAKEDTEENTRLVAENAAENARLARARIERFFEEQKVKVDQTILNMKSLAEKEEAERKKRGEQVKALKEQSESFVTPEDLDKCIEEALKDDKCYNFAINRKGQVIKRTQSQ